MNHGKIVSQSWEITWNNKAFWGLGFLAALTGGSGGGGGGGNFNGSTFGVDPASGEFTPSFLQEGPLARMIEGDEAALLAFAGIFTAVCVALLVLAIGFWIIGNMARVGLIDSVAKLNDGQKVRFGDAFRGGLNHLGRVFFLKLTLFAIVVIPILIVSTIIGVVIAATESPAIGVLFIPLFCVTIPIFIGLQFADALAYRGIVLKQMGSIEALRNGWALFRANVGDLLILGVIFSLISAVAAFVVGAILAIFAFASINPIINFFETGEITSAGAMTLLAGGVVTSIVGAALMSLITAWQSSGFTLAYLHITGENVTFDEKDPSDINDGSAEFI